jgi:hypothetical protein
MSAEVLAAILQLIARVTLIWILLPRVVTPSGYAITTFYFGLRKELG